MLGLGSLTLLLALPLIAGVDVVVNDTNLFRTDPRFLAVTIDSGTLCHSPPFAGLNLTDERLITSVRGLHPGLIRIGGSATDYSFYDSAGHTAACTYGPDDVQHLTDFAMAVGADVVWGLNAEDRQNGTTNSTTWNSTRARDFLNMVKARGLPIVGFELGNEPDQYALVKLPPVSPSQHALDYQALLALVQDVYGSHGQGTPASPWIIGPALTSVQDTPFSKETWLLEFVGNLSALGAQESIDLLSWHFYYESGNHAESTDFVSTGLFDRFMQADSWVRKAQALYLPNASLVLSETASAWAGGAPNISDGYVSVLCYADRLAAAASLGTKFMARQTLIGGAYGLLRHENDTWSANPSFFIGSLWAQLIGQVALPVLGQESLARSLRSYAMCTRQDGGFLKQRDLLPDDQPGSITLVLVNLEPLPVEIDLVLPNHAPERWEFLVTGTRLTSPVVAVNGAIGELDPATGAVPTFSGTLKRGVTGIRVDGESLAFVVVPGARFSSCP